MKVIQRRERPDPRLGRKSCYKCRSLLEIEKSDIPQMKSHRGDPHDQQVAGTWWGIRCPVCGAEVSLGRYTP